MIKFPRDKLYYENSRYWGVRFRFSGFLICFPSLRLACKMYLKKLIAEGTLEYKYQNDMEKIFQKRRKKHLERDVPFQKVKRIRGAIDETIT